MGKIKMEPTAGTMMPMLISHPVVLVGASVNGKPNFAAVAWVGVAASNPPAISIALQHHRHTLKGIRQNMTFSVNIPSTDLVKETDYCGLVSGGKTDKVSDTHFKIFYGSINSAPFIEQCPVNHACEVVQILDLGSHELVIGRIKETHISEDCLKDGRPDVSKIKPFFLTSGKYTAIGEPVGDAFRSGSVIAPEKAKEALEQFRKMRPPR
jgi:flavin reductase (DIM6/NTAB) family NADH-FMN oxidoreductase RutF